MSYPPPPRRVCDPAAAVALIAERPFAHLFTANGGLNATRIPFVADLEDGRVVKLRAHVNGQNPQAQNLDGAEALVAFSGAATYVSPHWRGNLDRGGTYDYEQAIVRGSVRVSHDVGAFRTLIDDLSALIEPQYAEVGDYEVWRTSMAPEGYIERLFPQVVAFEIAVESLEMVSKLHQHFPEAERRSIADHLARSHREDARAIGEKIRRLSEG